MENTEEYRPDSCSPPGHTLRDILEERKLSQSELCRMIKRPRKTICGIINGHVAITPQTALELEKALEAPPAEFWIRREALYQLCLARNSLKRPSAIK